MKILTLALALLFTIYSASAAEESFPLLKVGDVTYTNVTVTGKNANEIFIIHSQGVANVKLKKLSPELQKQFGYDPGQAATLEAQQARAKSNEAKASGKSIDSETGTASSNAARPKKEIWAKSFLNQPAPQIVVEKWLGAKPEMEGKFLLVDFWATWCPPCRKTIPELNRFHRAFGKKLVVMGLSDEPEEKVRAMKEPAIEYFSAIDTERRTLRAVDVRGIPHVLIIDPKGIVRWEGYPLLAGEELTEKVIDEIITKFGP